MIYYKVTNHLHDRCSQCSRHNSRFPLDLQEQYKKVAHEQYKKGITNVLTYYSHYSRIFPQAK